MSIKLIPLSWPPGLVAGESVGRILCESNCEGKHLDQFIKFPSINHHRYAPRIKDPITQLLAHADFRLRLPQTRPKALPFLSYLNLLN